MCPCNLHILHQQNKQTQNNKTPKIKLEKFSVLPPHKCESIIIRQQVQQEKNVYAVLWVDSAVKWPIVISAQGFGFSQWPNNIPQCFFAYNKE